MSLVQTAGQFIQDYGDTATLVREGEGTVVTLKARRLGGVVEAVGGGTAAQQVFRVKIGTAELLASAWLTKAPTRGDVLTIDGRARSVRDSRPIKDGAVVGLYELEVAG